MARRVILACAALIAGCAHVQPCEPVRILEPVRVEVPVPTRRVPPAELVAPYRAADLPLFVDPRNEAASSALTAEGERRLRALLSDLATRDEAWRRWAAEDAPAAVSGPLLTPTTAPATP